MDNVKGLNFIYDPANFLEVGEDPNATLDALHSRVDYFHIKDVISSTEELVPAGYGDGRIDQLVARIPREVDRVLTLEPHLAVFDGYSQIDEKKMKNKFKFSSNNEAFDAAVSAIKKILCEQGYKETKEGYEKI